jgi:centractin
VLPPLTPILNRVKTAKFLFESCHVSGVYITNTALMSLYIYFFFFNIYFRYASGNVNGIVLDCGEGCCTSTPIMSDKIIENAMGRIDIGGRFNYTFSTLYFIFNRDVTNRLNLLLRLKGYVFPATSELEYVREMKEKVGFL